MNKLRKTPYIFALIIRIELERIKSNKFMNIKNFFHSFFLCQINLLITQLVELIEFNESYYEITRRSN